MEYVLYGRNTPLRIVNVNDAQYLAAKVVVARLGAVFFAGRLKAQTPTCTVQ